MTPLETNIRKLKKQKEILLVSHAILGYPNFKLNEQTIDEMMKVGVDIIEFQIPFSDPQADGPFLTAANQYALDNKTTVEKCFEFSEKMCKKYPKGNFVFMTYFNIFLQYGIHEFVKRSAKIGIKGFIIPDLPIEESQVYINACKKYDLASIFMFTPETSNSRMKAIAKLGSGFMYCQARTGVTGKQTDINKQTEGYIKKCRKMTNLPIAIGFGITKKEDVDILKGKADIAICCTQAIKVLMKEGVRGCGEFLKSLR